MASFTTLIKPASSLCDLRCRYCFYADVSDLRQVKSYGIMSQDTAHTLIDRAFEACGNSGRAHFAFQGGEPTMAGLGFFEDFTAYAREHKPPGVSLHYSIQTNGMLIDDAWCGFLKQNGFLVGLSLDGDESLHDLSRVDAKGNGTAGRVMAAAAAMKRHGVEFNILSVVTRQAAKRPRQLFRFFKGHGFDYVQFIPCLASLDGPREQASYSLPPRLYASFLKELFAVWLQEMENGYYMSIRLFDNLTRMAAGQPPEMCGMLGFCQAQFVVEADGGVYPCDFYVLDEFRAGSVLDTPFRELAKAPQMKNFLSRPKQHPTPMCTSCRVRGLCGGGCYRYREFYFSEPGYCPYQDFLTSVLPGLRRAAAMAF